MRPKRRYNIAETEHLPEIKNCISTYDCTISRLDLSINCHKSNYHFCPRCNLIKQDCPCPDFWSYKLKNDFNFENLVFKKHHNIQVLKNYNGTECHAVTLGKGKDSIRLQIYDKQKDPNNFGTKQRFGTTNFARIEYKVPRKILKKIDISTHKIRPLTKHNHFNRTMGRVIDLTPENIQSLWLSSINTKHVQLHSLYVPKLRRNKTLKDTPTNIKDILNRIKHKDAEIDVNITGVRTMQMIKGLLKKYKFLDDYQKLEYSLNHFFQNTLEINEKTVKDTNAILYGKN